MNPPGMPTRVAIDRFRNPGRQLVLVERVTEVRNYGFVVIARHAQPSKLAHIAVPSLDHR